MPLTTDSSMNSARRRTGTYFHSEASASAPASVRAPQTTWPYAGKLRRQLMAWLLSGLILRVVQDHGEPGDAVQLGCHAGGPFPDAARCIGAGVEAGHGAAGGEGAPAGLNSTGPAQGCGGSRGPRSGRADELIEAGGCVRRRWSSAAGGSTITKARRCFAYWMAMFQVLEATSVVRVSGGMQRTLKRSAWSSSHRPRCCTASDGSAMSSSVIGRALVCGTVRVAVHDARDQRVRAAVQEEVPHRVAERAVGERPPKVRSNSVKL